MLLISTLSGGLQGVLLARPHGRRGSIGAEFLVLWLRYTLWGRLVC